MNVNKKKLAEIFGCDVRTVTAWQSQGLPLVSGGGKGNEAVFDTAAAISWYAERDVSIENEKLRKYTIRGIQFCGAVGYSECGRRRVPFGRTQPVQRQHC